MKNIVAIDVGASGGIAFTMEGAGVGAHPWPKSDEELIDIFNRIKFCENKRSGAVGVVGVVAYIEKVGGFVKPSTYDKEKGIVINSQPGYMMFNFGEKAGLVRGICLGLGFEVVMVTPQTWQKPLFIGTRGKMSKAAWKAKLKNIAQRRFPGIEVTLKTADALLILAYALLYEPNRGKAPTLAQNQLQAALDGIKSLKRGAKGAGFKL